MPHIFLVSGALFAFLAVATGAFGAHALKTFIGPEMLTAFEIGVRYQMYHALALLVVGLIEARARNPCFRWAGWLFIAGIVLFSGSLYVLALTGLRWYGAITPLGGVAFLAGWVVLGWGIWKGRNG